MRRLPLFPLPVVLLPGSIMPLHIFEARYRQMVARCLEYDRRFGLIYHDPDRMGPFGMEMDRVGTVAEIQEFQILPDGRSLLLAEGQSRFRIVDGIESDTLYYEGLVEPFEDEPPTDEEELMSRRRRSLDLFLSVVEHMRVEGEGELNGPPAEGEDEAEVMAQLEALDPADEISFRIAERIRVDPLWLQSFLELSDEASRLNRLDVLLSGALETEG
jgi:Lon protease-like protein